MPSILSVWEKERFLKIPFTFLQAIIAKTLMPAFYPHISNRLHFFTNTILHLRPVIRICVQPNKFLSSFFITLTKRLNCNTKPKLNTWKNSAYCWFFASAYLFQMHKALPGQRQNLLKAELPLLASPLIQTILYGQARTVQGFIK